MGGCGNRPYTKCLRRHRKKARRDRHILRCKEEMYDKRKLRNSVGVVYDAVQKEGGVHLYTRAEKNTLLSCVVIPNEHLKENLKMGGQVSRGEGIC